MAIWSQQRPWHPYRESKLGARETSAAICPQPWQKSQKKPCNKLFTSALKRLVGQRRLVQIYLPGRGEQSFHASTLEDGIGKKARRGGVCVWGKRSPRETFERRTIIKIPCQLKMAGSFLWTYGLHTLQGV